MFIVRFTALAGFLSLSGLIAYSVYFNNYWWLLASVIYYKIVVGLLGNQIAQHRYFTHAGFKTTKIKKYFLYLVSITTGVDPVDYAIVHRHHHAHSDRPGDSHSPHNRWYDAFSAVSGVSSSTVPFKATRVLDKDLSIFYKRYHYVLLAYVILTLLISWKVTVFLFLSGVAWNYLHMILFRVVLAHVKIPGSYRNFETSDQSWNNKWIQFIDIGEGLHNNHHQYPRAYNQAVTNNEFDPAGWIVDKFFVINENNKD